MFARSDKAKARRACNRAAALLPVDRGRAEELYREAVRLDPMLKEAWFDLGLIAKWEGRWESAFDCNMRAAELEGERAEEPAWWNLGIAATALRDWETARRAWAVYGVGLPDGSGPIEADLGPCPVRLNPHGESEVVWGDRIDPARIRISNIPFPQSGHRWADVVLHDGVPNGSRELQGRSVPVFDELMLWESSEVPTLQTTVHANASAADRLMATIEDLGYAAENWTANVRLLCAKCSAGELHAEPRDVEDARGTHFIAIAAPLDAVDRVLDAWALAGDCEVVSVEQVL